LWHTLDLTEYAQRLATEKTGMDPIFARGKTLQIFPATLLFSFVISVVALLKEARTRNLVGC